MIRFFAIAAAAAVARLGGAPNLAVPARQTLGTLVGKEAKSDAAAEAPAAGAASETPRRTRSFHISRKFIDDGVDDQQRLLRAAATVAPTPITSHGTRPHVSEEFCNTVTETEGGYCGGEKYPVAAGAFCKWTFCPAPATTS